jgi:hypothetical protein
MYSAKSLASQFEDITQIFQWEDYNIMRHIFLIVMAFTLPVVGQTTWGGLRFGMSEAEVKAAMKGRVETTGNAPGTQGYTPLWIKSVNVGPATGIATLSFDLKKKTLQRVWLNLSSRGETAFAGLTADEAASRVVAYEYVSRQLIERYGRPVNETERCPTGDEAINHFVREPLNTLRCWRLWREPSQTIEMDLNLVGDSLFLTVEYKSRFVTPSEL